MEEGRGGQRRAGEGGGGWGGLREPGGGVVDLAIRPEVIGCSACQRDVMSRCVQRTGFRVS